MLLLIGFLVLAGLQGLIFASGLLVMVVVTRHFRGFVGVWVCLSGVWVLVVVVLDWCGDWIDLVRFACVVWRWIWFCFGECLGWFVFAVGLYLMVVAGFCLLGCFDEYGYSC